MIVQWKETDLRFIRRLLAEIGIWFRFENHNKVKTETVVIFGDSARRYNFSDKQIPYVRHSGMTSYSEYITDLEEQHGLIPKMCWFAPITTVTRNRRRRIRPLKRAIFPKV